MTGELRVEVVDRAADFEGWRVEWNAAVAASLDPNLFLTWEWLSTWWGHFGEGDPEARLHIVVVRDDEGLVAAAPLFEGRRHFGPLRATVLQQVGYDAGDYGGVLLVRRHRDAVDALLDHVLSQLARGTSAAVFSRLATDGSFLPTLRLRLLARSADDARLSAREALLDGACPFADVRKGYDLRRQRKKHRVRQRMQRLQEKYDHVAITQHSAATLQDGLDRLVEVHRLRWRGKEDDFTGLLADPRHEAFLVDAVRAVDDAGWLRLTTLTADGRTAAADLDFEFAGRLYLFKAAFNPDFAEFAPGQLLTYRVFEDGIGRGVTEFDLMRGDHPYKRVWADEERQLVTVTLTRSGPAGQVATTRLRAVRLLSKLAGLARRRAVAAVG